nr:TetR/AcrR family transcriptional regulator [Lachnospiraceae bacterium]
MGNKDNILNVALELFARKGYVAVGVQEIADTAGITKPTLYHYFKSKYGLLECLLQDRFGSFCDILEGSIKEDNKGLVNRLNDVAREYIMYSISNKDMYSLAMAMLNSSVESDTRKAIEPYYNRIRKIFVDIFELSKHELGNMNGRQRQFAMVYWGILNSYVTLMNEHIDEYEDTDNVENDI